MRAKLPAASRFYASLGSFSRLPRHCVDPLVRSRASAIYRSLERKLVDRFGDFVVSSSRRAENVELGTVSADNADDAAEEERGTPGENALARARARARGKRKHPLES